MQTMIDVSSRAINLAMAYHVYLTPSNDKEIYLTILLYSRTNQLNKSKILQHGFSSFIEAIINIFFGIYYTVTTTKLLLLLNG